MHSNCILSVLIMLVLAQRACASPMFEQTTLFQAGEGAYDNYRIPAMVRTTKNTILAFCEGRQTPRGPGNDTGEINTILRRSTDGGKTFGPVQVVWADGKNTCGNPCPVVDEITGTVWLFNTHNLGEDHEKDIIAGKTRGTRTVWVTHSDDDGVTWAKPTDITAQVKKPEWAWYATGPGNGIQIKNGPHKGRLVIPCDFIATGGGPDKGNSFAIYSDDHGKTWILGAPPKQPRFNESQVVELEGGRVMLNMRNAALPKGEPQVSQRGVSISDDGGATFGDAKADATLVESRCQASILRYSWAADGKSRILFSNPASATLREAMTVRVSYDEAQSWEVSKTIFKDFSAYSSLVTLPNGDIGLFYEAGEANKKYDRIDFARFNLEWLTDGKDKGETSKASATNWNWQELAPFPDPVGVAGAFVGESNGAVLMAGGANFPKGKPWEGGPKVFSSAIHVLQNSSTQPSAAKWIPNIGQLSRALAYGASITTDHGVILMGGCDGSSCSDAVTRMRWSEASGIQSDKLPSLPTPLAFHAAGMAGNIIFVAGGQTTVDKAVATNTFYTLDLSKEGTSEFTWQKQPSWPGPARVLPIGVASIADGVPTFQLFSGRNVAAGMRSELLTDAYAFNYKTGKWNTLPAMPACMMGGSGLMKSPNEVLLIGGDSGEIFAEIENLRSTLAQTTESAEKQTQQKRLNEMLESHPGFPANIVRYDIARKTYELAGELPKPSPLTTTCIVWNARILIPSGEISPGIRIAKVWVSDAINNQKPD